jgi:amphi-Trp domain-containing protein
MARRGGRMTARPAVGAVAEPIFFEDAAALRGWFEANHDKAPELWLGLRKKGSGLTSVSYKEAVDVALCFGWIDSAMKPIDATSYRQRFTPRRKGSVWSAVNIARVGELVRLGLMHPAGMTAFEARDPAKTNRYSFEQAEVRLAEPYEARFRENPAAWRFFQSQPPSYRKAATWWVMSAKREETRERRLRTLIEDSEQGRRIAPLTFPARKEHQRNAGQEEQTMKEPARDIEKGYPLPDFVAKLRRLADALEAGERFTIQIAGERIRVPAAAICNIEHERSEYGEEIEFQIKWRTP